MHKIFSVVVYVFVLMLPFTLTGVAGAVDSSELRAAVTLDGVRAHQYALQSIADANVGNRAENTTGFSASSDYVRDQLIAAGYAVTIQSFDATSNLIAELPGDDSRLVIAGAHLDSVAAGPGNQDNGSGAAAILEIALQMAALGIEPVNRVRFVWWGAEETTGNGTRFHLLNMTTSERNAALYLNFDMLGSSNGVRFVYDGDSSDTSIVNPGGSAKIEQVFLDYFASAGQATLPSDISEHPALPEFRTAGIPVGGLFGGAFGIKTEAEVAVFGGTAGDQYDPCHHLACDTVNNINLRLLDEYADAAAHTILHFALTSVAEESFDDLMDAVASLPLASAAGLAAKLDAAQAAIARGNERAGINLLMAFIRQVEAKRRTGELSDTEADALIAEAQLIIDSLL
jgi:aminopeptidase S